MYPVPCSVWHERHRSKMKYCNLSFEFIYTTSYTPAFEFIAKNRTLALCPGLVALDHQSPAFHGDWKIILARNATRSFTTQSHLQQDARQDVIYVDTCWVVKFNSIVAQFSFQLICIIDHESIRKFTIRAQSQRKQTSNHGPTSVDCVDSVDSVGITGRSVESRASTVLDVLPPIAERSSSVSLQRFTRYCIRSLSAPGRPQRKCWLLMEKMIYPNTDRISVTIVQYSRNV